MDASKRGDAKFQAFRKEAVAYVTKWRGRLFLHEWNINVCQAKGPKEDNPEVCADCTPDHRYLTAKIMVYPAWSACGKEDRERCIVHELSHCITSELISAARSMHNGCIYPPHVLTDMMERLTQRVTNAAFLGWDR